MMIKRLQVEEGFLDGLDLFFSKGLNVLIGARGAGKTSIIELIRFCLGVKGFTDRFDVAAREHALAVLGAGEVTVTLELDGSEVIVMRTATDAQSRKSASYTSPIILSQNEIELVGLQAEGRLRIIDGFRSQSRTETRKESLLSTIQSLTVESRTLCNEIASIEEQLRTLAMIPDLLKRAKADQESALKSITDATKKQTELKEVDEALTSASVREALFSRVLKSINIYQRRIEELLSTIVSIESWPETAGPTDQLADTRTKVDTAAQHLSEANSAINQAINNVNELRTSNGQQRVQIDQKARELRRQLDTLKEGAGAAARHVSDLQEKAGHLKALKSLLKDKKRHLLDLRDNRGKLLEELEQLRDKRFQERNKIAEDLNRKLGPRIEVQVERAGIYPEYISAIGSALRGSGLHYNTLAPLLADRMSPRELAEAAESRSSELISSLTGISLDRSERVCEEIASHGTEKILTSELHDSVKLSLLDGGEYKSTENLSTGQRCTVILPILLGHSGKVLIVDQPEDHLDNAFIVETLVEAIIDQKNIGQLIFSTHNANIPVLGEADQIVLLGSDGKRGFVRHVGGLEDIKSVDAISTVMEGGKEAFERRAFFYAKRYSR